MLQGKLALGNVDDVDGFVASTLARFETATGGRLERDERDELHLEGLAIMWELWQKFEPRREGYEQDGTFSGFAACYLPKRLGDFWHRRHPEHKRIAGGDGKRKWVYLKNTVSLEHHLTEDGVKHGDGESGGDCKPSRRLLPAAQWTAVPVSAPA